ncbi:thymidine phosphorylase [Jiella sp. MQZ9-1]|uniref:Thymidine phosphorylase n=1 Tax=Jiella flava TaxID=2816857 RepID=A0A939JTD2_9HYPH|nr:thymidine phosphorylase [Jiella flava]MBO0662000.1 thymidine phosphorylase [Jiella flava]MCD2470673.1 thymidine phosphorylase [Jiella flava]
MLPQEVIARKRDGLTLSAGEIRDFVTGFADGTVGDAQIAAFAMAVIFRGLAREETVALTEAMRDSGAVMAWPGLDKPVVDKHSTGGIGDNVSLMLAPILAACGAAVPMISGRGLGHTGGTLDKLEAIPGYRVVPDNATSRRTVSEVGCAIVGPTAELAPADGRFYRVRDVTATVESVPLIVASILSKKLAEGLSALVLDVKTGSGAFMVEEAAARDLAEQLTSVANGAGLKTRALLTRMDQALAPCAGNAVEVKNAIDFLTGAHRDKRLEAVTLALAAELLTLCGLAGDIDAGRAMANRALDGGAAAERFGRMVAALGGPTDLIERVGDHLPRAPLLRPVAAAGGGVVQTVDARALGLAVVELGGGRRLPEDRIDPAVGLSALAAIGQRLAPDEPLALVHARDEAGFERAAARVRAAYRLAEAVPPALPPVLEHIRAWCRKVA